MSETILDINTAYLSKRIAYYNERINFLEQVRDAVTSAPRVGKTHIGFWNKIAETVGCRAWKSSYVSFAVELSRQVEPELYRSTIENAVTFSIRTDWYNVKFTDEVVAEIVSEIEGYLNSDAKEQSKMMFQLIHLREFLDRYNELNKELTDLYVWFKGSKYSGPTLAGRNGEARLTQPVRLE